ncbi:MAG TPA: hypothetical protein VFZ53_18740 [Polyangiaceae bacterium]
MVGKRIFIFGAALAGFIPSCGSSENGHGGGGTGGTGGTAPNSCPPTLVNYGSGPGILCDEPAGTTCADTEQFCVCGEQGFEGAPWHCVPTSAGCPTAFPEDTPCDTNASESCDYLTSVRETCTCVDDAWQCEPTACPINYPGTGRPCALDPGDTCRFFLPASPSDPDHAPNVTCTCTAGQTWSCPSG